MSPHRDVSAPNTQFAASGQGQEAAVLVVDDTPDKRQLLEALLRHSGYYVFTANDGLEAFEVARSVRPDLIISDVAMPVMDGIELCRRVRAEGHLGLTPILLVSAMRKDSESVIEGLRAGADDYLEAPYDPMRLVALSARLVERGRAGRALLDSARALRESERRYRLLFEDNPQPMWVFDEETLSFLAVNEAAERQYGYTREEFLRMTIKDIRPSEDVPALLEDLARRPRSVDAGGHWRHRKKDGVVFDVEITTHALEFDGRPAELVLVRDVSEQRRAQEALHEVEEQLRQSQKLEAVGQLAGGIAHDFNNLLTVISGYSDLALRRLAAEDPLGPSLREIKRAASRAASLTGQLLAFSRKQVLQPRVIDLNEVVAEMDKLLRRLIGEDIRLVAEPEPGLWRVKADPGQLSQVIINLAVNARDAMPRGGSLTIETKNVHLDETYSREHVSVRPGPYVMLAVSDTGVGMDAEIQRRMFEPFFTTKELGKGTGLGLAMVYGVVKQSGGNIWVYSEPGQGTTFKIYLPRVEAKALEGRADATPSEPPRGSETLLIVEDEEMVRGLLCEILEAEGYTVLAAANGEQALRTCEQQGGQIALVITDVVMPGMSGRELAKQLNEKWASIKVLYMSGYADKAVVHHGVLEAGINFLQKPFTPAEVIRKAREVLDTHA